MMVEIHEEQIKVQQTPLSTLSGANLQIIPTLRTIHIIINKTQGGVK